jgi:hypothetical protein
VPQGQTGNPKIRCGIDWERSEVGRWWALRECRTCCGRFVVEGLQTTCVVAMPAMLPSCRRIAVARAAARALGPFPSDPSIATLVVVPSDPSMTALVVVPSDLSMTALVLVPSDPSMTTLVLVPSDPSMTALVVVSSDPSKPILVVVSSRP